MSTRSRGWVGALVVVVVAGAWLGASLLVSTTVAPAAFTMLPSRTLAGALVGQVLPTIFMGGAIAGGLSIVLELLDSRTVETATRVVTSVVWCVACLAAQYIVSPRIERLRAAAGGPIDALPSDSQIRLDFGRLHGVSVGLLGLAMLAALIALILAARRAAVRD